MKNTLFILLAALAFYCCSDNNSEPENGNNDIPQQLSRNSVISVGVKESPNPKSKAIDKKSPRFITLYAWDYKCKFNQWDDSRKDIEGFTDSSFYRFRDTINWKIKFRDIDVIDPWGNLGPFTRCTNIILRTALDKDNTPVWMINYTGTLDLQPDTIGYIPNALMQRNLLQLQKLFEAKDFEACYRMFDTAYYFIPVTGAEYRKLVENGTEVRDTTKTY